MINPDNYKTIAAPSKGEFKDRGSKFFGYAFPIYREEEWQFYLEEVKKEHFKARHHCYAFRLGLDKNNFRANDDGEPSNSAGKPILGQIDSFGLSNVFIVVVRYFGGTKLGVSGLINAYRTAAAEALEAADIIEKTVEDIYRFTFDYALMSPMMTALKKHDALVTKQDFGEIGVIEIAIPQSQVEETLLTLKADIAQVRITEMEEMKNVAGLKVDYVLTR